MTPEQQRFAIAEVCGWKDIHPLSGCLQGIPKNGGECDRQPLPDYLNDLNAIREAEEHIPLEKHQEYFNRLVYSEYPVPLDQLELTRRAVFASAPQKAEAFLRNLNLWHD